MDKRTTSRLLAAAALALSLSAAAASPPSAKATSATAMLATEPAPAASSATSDLPLPQQMAAIGDARQLVVATGSKLGDRAGVLQVFDYENGAWVCTLTVPCRFGRRGLRDGLKRHEGDKTTPTGLWKMPSYVFGYRAKAPAGTTMRYVRITKRSWWSSRRGSSYNNWIEAKHWRGERLYNVAPQYEYAVSTGYNAKPNASVYGRGTGIFLHVQGKGLTSGCISIPRGAMWRVAALLDPSKHPAFAVGTLQRGSSTSIWAY